MESTMIVMFFFKKAFEFWDWKSISVNEFVSKTGFNDIELQVVITLKDADQFNGYKDTRI